MPKSKRIVLAIDPGKGGGFVWGASLDEVQSAKMPDGCKNCKELLEMLHELGDVEAYSEYISGFMGGLTKKNKETGEEEACGPSPKAMFSFGRNVMMVEMGLECVGIKNTIISPQSWQNKAGVSTLKKQLMTPTQWKNYLKDEAQKRFPTHKMTLKTADAFLIFYAVMTNDL